MIGIKIFHYNSKCVARSVSDRSDASLLCCLCRWLALTPPELVRAHLNLETSQISQFNKTKGVVVG